MGLCNDAAPTVNADLSVDKCLVLSCGGLIFQMDRGWQASNTGYNFIMVN